MPTWTKEKTGTVTTVITLADTNVGDLRVDVSNIMGPNEFVNLKCFGQAISAGGWSINIEGPDGIATDEGPYDGATNINDIVPVKIGWPAAGAGPTKVILRHTPKLDPQSSEDYR